MFSKLRKKLFFKGKPPVETSSRSNQNPGIPVYDFDNYFDTKSTKKHRSTLNKTLRFLGNIFVNIYKSTLKAINKKKNEQLTLMFIPHNEKKISNYSISNLSLTAFLSIVGLCLIFGSVLIINHTSMVQEVGKLKESHKNSKIQFIKIRDEIKDISVAYDKVKNILSDMVKMTGGKESLKDIYYGLGGAAIPISKLKSIQKNKISSSDSVKSTELDDKNNSRLKQFVKEEHIPLEIFILDKIINDMGIISHELDYIDGHMKRDRKSIQNSPTLWPANGYIMNPFGFVRKSTSLKAGFNTGFDIATPPGAKIIVTAPGKINSIVREKNSLFTVRVKHHYGYRTVYYGLSELTVKLNATISKGETIGYMGLVSGPSENALHYEIYIGTEVQDPSVYLYSSKE